MPATIVNISAQYSPCESDQMRKLSAMEHALCWAGSYIVDSLVIYEHGMRLATRLAFTIEKWIDL